MTEPLGLRLKAIREFYGWSQRELAKRAGVPNSAISVIEQGSVSPSISSLEKVLKGFSISLADFFAISINSPPINIAPINIAHTQSGLESAPLLADFPQYPGCGLSLRFFKRQADDAPDHILAVGPTLVLLVAGEATYHSPGVEQPLVCGSNVSLSATTMFRVQPVAGTAEWVVASVSGGG